MGQPKKATGKMAYYMVKEVNIGQWMALVTKDHIKKENPMELVCLSLLMEIFMKENGNNLKNTGMEKWVGGTGVGILEIGKIIKKMVKESNNGQVVIIMMENGVEIRNMDMEK